MTISYTSLVKETKVAIEQAGFTPTKIVMTKGFYDLISKEIINKTSTDYTKLEGLELVAVFGLEVEINTKPGIVFNITHKEAL
jgi:hypothetical protein